MSLTLGTGPFARPERGELNFDLRAAAPAHALYLHDVDRRVRGVLAGTTLVDTTRARMLHETGLLPQWYVPVDDVRTDLLTRTSTRTHCPFKGDASYWTATVGDRVEEDLVWGYEQPLPAMPGLAGLVAMPFDRLDEWYEEDERALGHPRDPFHRVDTRRSSRHVVVRVGGEVVADSTRPVALFETGLPTRWYVPEDDVRTDLLEATGSTSVCPYKGVAGYWTARVAGTEAVDVAFGYPEPLEEALATRGHLCFLGDEVRTEVDGAVVDG